MYLPITECTSQLQGVPPSYRVYLPITGFTSILQGVPPNYRVYLPITECTSQLQGVPPSYRVYLPITECTSQLQGIVIQCISMWTLCLHWMDYYLPPSSCWLFTSGTHTVTTLTPSHSLVPCSGSMWGGCMTVLMFLFNHTESTRVMWTPPLRESFAMPLIMIQLLALSHALRCFTVHVNTHILYLSSEYY